MRNDEKIDINLTLEETPDNLSEEELAQQNYETALRYINIAEHMNKFEDQDKYYHRAIQYLKKARPYIEVRPLLRDLKKKKFNARAEGKLTLYKEACNIRDRAKTPSDYYSAQTIFSRIYYYEQKHPLVEKWTDPTLYVEASKCNDSGEQMQLCEQLANEKSAELKRHSFFVSCTFIACILAFLFFTRTSSFNLCLGNIYSHTGNYEKAWKNYKAVYQKNNDPSIHEKVLEYRYKAAKQAEQNGDTETAYINYKILSKSDYKDSSSKFIALEKSRVKNTKIGEIASFGNIEWRVLDKKDNKVLLIKDIGLASKPFDETGKNVTWESSSIRKWLNEEFLQENFTDDERNNILETTVKNKPNATYNTPAGKDTKDKFFLLSCDEAEKYYDALHITTTCWWLRTPGAFANSMSFVYRDKTIMDYGYEVTNTKITIKPVMWLNVE